MVMEEEDREGGLYVGVCSVLGVFRVCPVLYEVWSAEGSSSSCISLLLLVIYYVEQTALRTKYPGVLSESPRLRVPGLPSR